LKTLNHRKALCQASQNRRNKGNGSIREVKFFSILVLLALLCEPAFGQTIAAEWYMKGMDLYSQGNYAGAIQAYDKAIEIDPQYADAWAYKSNALRQLGQAAEAEHADAAYAKIVDAPGYKRPLTALDWSSEGDLLKAQGKYEEAIKAYDKAIEIDPEDELGWSLSRSSQDARSHL